MSENVNIEVPNYYYWEGDEPALPDTNTKISYKLVGPDSTSIQISAGFIIESAADSYKITGKRPSSKLTLSFSNASTNTENGIITARTSNSTVYSFKGTQIGKKYEVTKGKVKIVESKEQKLKNQASKSVETAGKGVDTYIQGTVAKAETLKSNKFFASSEVLNKLSKLCYLFFKDFFTLFFTSLIIVTIIIILKVDAELIYPTDFKKFPYVNNEHANNISEVADKNSDSFCIKIAGTGNPEPPKYDPLQKSVLSLLNPIMSEYKKIYWAAEAFHNSCSTTDQSSSAASVLKYWMLYLVLKNFNFMDNNLQMIHRGFGALTQNKVVLFTFTVLLLFFYFTIPRVSIDIVQPFFKAYIKDPTRAKDLIMLIVYNIMAILITLFIPLFVILASSCVLGNIYNLIQLILSSASIQCMILSFFTLICSVNFVLNLLPADLSTVRIEKNPTALFKQVISLIFKIIRTLKMPKINVRSVFFFFISLLSFLGSIFGIFFPVFMALYYSLSIGFKILFGALSLPLEQAEITKRLIFILVFFLFAIMLKDVYKVLGRYFFIITIFIIIVTGIIMIK